MLELKNLQEFVADWNYLMQGEDQIEDPAALEEILNMVKISILEQCGIQDAPVRIMNNLGQIEEIK